MKISSILKVAGTVASVVGAYKAGRYIGETGMICGFCGVEKTCEGSASLGAQEILIASNPENIVSKIDSIHSFSDFIELARVTTVGLFISERSDGILNYLQDLRAACYDVKHTKSK